MLDANTHAMTDGADLTALETLVATSRTGINPLTWLATDFLNQYNEIAMMLENIDAWPEGLLELKAWQPLDYETHFAKSGLADSGLVITAYQHAPFAPRARFQRLVTETNRILEKALAALLHDFDGGDWQPLLAPAHALATEIRQQTDQLRLLINVENTNIAQDGIDSMFGELRQAS